TRSKRDWSSDVCSSDLEQQCIGYIDIEILMGELCQYRRSGCRRPHSYDQPDAESYEHAAENSVDQYFIGFDMPRFRHPQEERHEEHNEYRVVHGAFAQKFKTDRQ